MLEYAPKGLVGVLTPQANTTVEAEFSILKPPSIGLITSRLTSKKPTINSRLIEYINQIDNNLEEFANAPLKTVLFACTGASYFFESTEEKEYLKKISSKRGYPIISATTAISDALNVIKPKKIGIISPYNDELHNKAMSYWKKIPYNIKVIKRLKQKKNNFHPIYTIQTSTTKNCLYEIESENCDLILFLGTGLPTLPSILDNKSNLIVISANLCLIWRTCLIIEKQKPSQKNLKEWYTGIKWRKRFFSLVSM